MASARPIVVIGSINMDLVCRTPRMPRAGETLLGSDLITIPGGKGANQAVAAAKLAGAELPVHMVGSVGNDDIGQRLLNGLRHHGVGTTNVTVTEGTPSGCAIIIVDGQGENCIVVAPGANAKVLPAHVDAAENIIASAAAVVLQLEIPLATVQHAIAMCQRLGVYTILDPAPAQPLPRACYGVDLFTPNENEAQSLLGIEQTAEVSKTSVSDPKQLASGLLSQGAKQVVLKLGSKGSLYCSHDGQIQTVPAFRVNVADTTAAGDAFTAALAVSRAEQMDTRAMLRFANAAAAACCQSFGAQPALPTRQDVETLLRRG
jgi:ribokinase